VAERRMGVGCCAFVHNRLLARRSRRGQVENFIPLEKVSVEHEFHLLVTLPVDFNRAMEELNSR
jgi:hypothetical protein